MIPRRVPFGPISYHLRSIPTRAASNFARLSAHDPRPLQNSHGKTQDTKQRQLNAERKKESHQTAPSISHSEGYISSSPSPQQPATSEPYHVQRTPTRNFPVYQLRKRGGNLKQTRLRKVSGQTSQLLRSLTDVLTPAPEWVRINPMTGHIEMKGWYKDQIEKFLLAKGF